MGVDRPPAYDAAMTVAVVWHYWIAVPLAAGAVLAVVATVGGYLKKVQSMKYPRR